MANNNQPEGRWVTIRGRRVFIKNDGYGEYREPNDKRQVERAKKILDSTKSDYNNAKREYLRNPDGKRYNHGFVPGLGYAEWSYSNEQAMLDEKAHLDNSQKVYDAVKHNSIKKVTWQDRDADKKDREIAARQKEIDERNGKKSEDTLIKESKKVFTKLRGLADNKTNDYQGTIKEMFKALGGTVYVRVRGNTLEYDGNVNGRKLSGSILRGEENYRYNMLAEDLAMTYYRNNGGSIGYTPALIEKFGNK